MFWNIQDLEFLLEFDFAKVFLFHITLKKELFKEVALLLNQINNYLLELQITPSLSHYFKVK